MLFMKVAVAVMVRMMVHTDDDDDVNDVASAAAAVAADAADSSSVDWRIMSAMTITVSANTTGDESLYTVYEGHEIMFHVSTLLPFSADNKQQVYRLRQASPV